MEILDLSRHGPEQLTGKRVTLRGRSYRLGERFRESSQGYAHLLFNEVSGLCLHLLQIRISYRADPAAANEGSRQKERLTAQLRAGMLASGQDASVIPVVSCHDIRGGTAELHEVGHALAPLPSSDVLGLAAELVQRGDAPQALAELTAYLSQHPDDTVVLERAALLHLDGQRYNEAIGAARRAIETEPNLAQYRGTAMLVGFGVPAARAGIRELEKLRILYREVHDYDEAAIRGLLHCGEPEMAADVLKNAPLPVDRRATLKQNVDHALAQKTQANLEADKVGRRIKRDAAAALDPAVLQAVRAASERYPADARLRANLGLLLRAQGEYSQAATYLLQAAATIDSPWPPTCWANAGFAKLAMGNTQEALPLLEAASGATSAGAAQQSAWDVPGVTLWLDAQSSIETYAPSAADLIDAADASHPGWRDASDGVEQLCGLYRQARSRFEIGGAAHPSVGRPHSAGTHPAPRTSSTLQRLMRWLKRE
jgi:tetratricopeptide (TPR) repeat protein